MAYEPSTMSHTLQSPYTNSSSNPTPLYTPVTRPTPSYHHPIPAATENDDSLSVSASLDGVKKKRGRPRKYSPEASVSVSVSVSHSAELSSGKKPRGRPPGSLNKQHLAASGSPGVGFMPHILDVKAGEDVLAKMMWFSQNSTRAMCVLSANGAISNVTLSQSPTSTVTYEGYFEILSLSGSFMVSEVGGQRSRTGGLSVALSGPDGRVLGGNLAGILTAASPVQVIVGSFVPSSQKQKNVGGAASNHEADDVNILHSESLGGGLGSPFDHSSPQAMANINWR